MFSAIGDLLSSLKQKKAARNIHPVNTTYEENPYIKSLYGEGRNLYQGRMAGAGSAEQNIFTNQANQFAGVQNNATDSSQALALISGIGGQTNSALSDLGTRESLDKQRRFGAFSNVSQLMSQEGDKVYQDKLRNYYDDLNYKRALEGSAMQNRQNALGEIDSQVEMAASLLSGGFVGGGGSSGGSGRGQRTSQNQVRQPYYGYNPRTGGYYTD